MSSIGSPSKDLETSFLMENLWRSRTMLTLFMSMNSVGLASDFIALQGRLLNDMNTQMCPLIPLKFSRLFDP